MNKIKYKDSDLIGKKFGRLLVTGPEDYVYDSKGKKFRALWCKCDCGNTKLIRIYNLYSKVHPTQSCGCLSKENIKNLADKRRSGEIPIPKHTTHGLSKTRLYRIHKNMKSRCYNPNVDNYKWYGGQGIKIEPIWDNSEDGFINFYNWSMSHGYNDTLEIDRIDSTKHYGPDNCRWVSRTQQNNNKCNNNVLEYYGFRFTASEWSKLLDIDANVIRRRSGLGWSTKDIFETPIFDHPSQYCMKQYKENIKTDIVKPILQLDFSKLNYKK